MLTLIWAVNRDATSRDEMAGSGTDMRGPFQDRTPERRPSLRQN